MVKFDLYDGKYTYIREDDGSQRALRYGKPWRDLIGDGFVLAMAQEIEDLQEKLIDADTVIFKLNSGKELQDIMNINNKLSNVLLDIKEYADNHNDNEWVIIKLNKAFDLKKTLDTYR